MIVVIGIARLLDHRDGDLELTGPHRVTDSEDSGGSCGLGNDGGRRSQCCSCRRSACRHIRYDRNDLDGR